MSKEYSEFIFALRAIVNAVDRKGLVLPKEKPVGKVRDINSRHRSPDENQPDEPGAEEPPPAEEKSKSPLKEALLGEWNYHPDQAISAPPRKQQKAIQQMKSKGFSIVIWEKEYVAMMDKKGNPAEVYPDGTVKYPKKR